MTRSALFLSLILLLSVSLSANAQPPSLFATPAESAAGSCTQGVIVLRHAYDLPNPGNGNPDWPGTQCFQVPGYKPVQTEHRRLCSSEYPNDQYAGKCGYDDDGKGPYFGVDSANYLGTKLQEWITGDLSLCPVSRVYIEDPTKPSGATPNPFDTIFPFLVHENITDIHLDSFDKIKQHVHNGPDDLFPDDQHSVIISWDVAGLWGGKSDDGKRTFDSSGILAKLTGNTSGEGLDYPMKTPQPGTGFYVFKNYDGKKFSYATYPVMSSCKDNDGQPVPCTIKPADMPLPLTHGACP